MAARARARLFVETDLASGARIELDDAQSHYLATVLRLGPGAAVAVFNGRDGEHAATLAEVGKRRVTLAVGSRTRAQTADGDLWLVFAPVKRAKLDLLVEKATELGAAALLPAITERTVVERMNVDRLRAHAVEAAEQSERLTVPALRAPVPLDRLLSAWPAGRTLVVCDETGAAPPFAEAIQGLLPEAPAALLVGPEGGFTGRELDGLRNLAFAVPAALGPRVLRSETACLAALAAFQCLRGDWRRSRPAAAPPAPELR